eukprot:2925835-Lingulodinium_polyedra.AAC.1
MASHGGLDRAIGHQGVSDRRGPSGKAPTPEDLGEPFLPDALESLLLVRQNDHRCAPQEVRGRVAGCL